MACSGTGENGTGGDGADGDDTGGTMTSRPGGSDSDEPSTDAGTTTNDDGDTGDGETGTGSADTGGTTGGGTSDDTGDDGGNDHDSDADWLHTEGNTIVDANGMPVWLTGANWFGFNASERVFHGLWSANLEDIIRMSSERGINILRVPISTQLLIEWKNGEFDSVNVNTHANPELEGMNSLQIFDHFLEVSGRYGLKVLLDVHSAEADNSGHVAPLWYKGDVTEAMFYEGWVWVAERYKDDDTIVAFDLQNEPHGKPYSEPEFAKWDDSSDSNNWKHACEKAAKLILEVHPRILVLCEGIESYPIDGTTWTSSNEDDYHGNWWGGNLRGVKDYPVDLGANQDQLVYSPHDYGPAVFEQSWFYPGFDKSTLIDDVWYDNWLYIHVDDIAPLLIGEWGGFLDDGDNEKWMASLRDLIDEYKLHHTFWCINPNSGDTGGLLLDDWESWDEEKYSTMLKPVLWQDRDGKFVGLDHQIPLGNRSTGTTITGYYDDNGAPPVGP